MRSVAFIFALFLLVAFLAFTVWFLIETITMLRSGTLKLSPTLHHILASGDPYSRVFWAILFLSVFFGLMNAVFDADAKIKILLTLRAMRKSADTTRAQIDGN